MTSPGDGMIRIPEPADRDDLRILLRRLLRLDEASVVRLTRDGEGKLRVWGRTPFGQLVVRTLRGDCPGGDVVAGADHLLTELDVLPRGDSEGLLDPGMPLLSAWQGILPPTDGFQQVEIIPAQVMLDLTEAGRAAAKESAGPAGLPPSLLDQEALTLRADSDHPLGVDMRSVFSLVMCGFVPEKAGRAPEGEPVRVSERGAWLRLDGRYGTVFRRTDVLSLEPLR